MEAPKYTIYELLEAMVERIGWQSEAQKLDMLAVVYAAKEVNAVGVIGTMMACPHNDTQVQIKKVSYSSYPQTVVVCVDCGRTMG